MIWKIRKLSQVDFVGLKEKNKSVMKLETVAFRLRIYCNVCSVYEQKSFKIPFRGMANIC